MGRLGCAHGLTGPITIPKTAHMRCSQCRHENRDEARVCEACGSPPAHTCPACGNLARAPARAALGPPARRFRPFA